MNLASPKKQNGLLKAVIATIIFSFPLGAFAAGPPLASELSNTLAQVLIAIIVSLLLAIILLANVVTGAAQLYTQRFKEAKKNSTGGDIHKVGLMIAFCVLGADSFAQVAPPPAGAATGPEFSGLSATSFYILVSVILIEVLILLVLLFNLKLLLAKEAAITAVTAGSAPHKSFDWGKWWWEKVNSLRPAHEEANIDLGHDYDGIRELDNRLPPWWLYGFYLCILVSGIYLWRYHVAKSAPLSKEEFQIAQSEAVISKEAYLKKSANKVDENTVTYLTDAASLDAGKKIFSTICIACHLADGGGSVGPNLTDKFWIHGGSIKDIFKTLKYGWPEKGMKSWKDDYSPVQLAQIASYVKSLVGTTPAKAKEAQGVLYEETAPSAATGSVKIVDTGKKPDSTKK